jgi:hypothetical protein
VLAKDNPAKSEPLLKRALAMFEKFECRFSGQL